MVMMEIMVIMVMIVMVMVMVMATLGNGNFWQLLATDDIFWHLMASFGN